MHLDERLLESEGILLLCDGAMEPISIKVNFSRKALRLSLRVLGHCPIATLPLRRCRDLSVLKEFILAHAQWIRKTISRQKSAPPEPIPSPCVDGCKILLGGEWVEFKLRPNDKHPGKGCWQIDQNCTLLMPLGLQDYKPLLEELLKKAFLKNIKTLVEKLSHQLGIPYRQLSVRKMKTKWGSCRSNRNISLNWKMIHAPLWAQEYLIIHELCHLKEMNHSAKFWALVARYSPRFEEARKWFSAHS